MDEISNPQRDHLVFCYEKLCKDCKFRPPKDKPSLPINIFLIVTPGIHRFSENRILSLLSTGKTDTVKPRKDDK